MVTRPRCPESVCSSTGCVVLPAPQFGRFYGGTRGRGVLSREEEAQRGPPAPQGFQSTLQMRSSWARHDFSMLLLSRSHRRSSPPKHPVSRRVPLTRQQEMGRSLPNWELSTNRFYFVRLLSRTNAILIPQLPDRLLVLREVGQIGLLLLLFLQSLSASSPYCMKEESPLNGVLEDDPSRGDECFTRLSYTDSRCTSVLSPLSSFSPRISLWAAISSSDTDL